MYDLLWVLELEAEVESDLSVFHRIDDMSSMGSRRWARLVPRLFAYAGAVQMRARTMQDGQPPEAEVEPETGGGGVASALPAVPAGAKQVEATATALQFSDIGDMFSFG